MNPWLLVLAAAGAIALVNGLLVLMAYTNNRMIFPAGGLAPIEKLGVALAFVGGLMLIGALYGTAILTLD